MFSKTALASSDEVIGSTPELVELMMSRTDLGPRVGSWVSINYFDEDKKCYEPRDRQALAPYVALARNVRGLDCILALYQYDSRRSGYISLPESEYAAFSRALKNKKIEFWLHEEAKWKLLLQTQLRQEMSLGELVSLISTCREWPSFPHYKAFDENFTHLPQYKMAGDLKHPVKNIYLLAGYARVSPIYYYRFDETKGVYTYQSNRAGAADYLTFLPLAAETQAKEQAILEPLEFYPLRRVADSYAQHRARGEKLRELMIREEMSAIAELEEKEKMLHAELHLIKKEKTEREMRIRKIKAFFKPKAEN